MIAATFALALLTASPERISFQKALELATAQQPSVMLASLEAERAHALVEQARAPSLPSLSAGLTYTQLDSNQIVAAGNLVNGTVQLSLPLLAPTRWAQWRRAADVEEIAGLNLMEAKRLASVAAARTWLLVLAQHRVVQAQLTSVETAEAHLAYARNRKSAGLGNQLDVLRAEQEVSLAQSQRAAAVAALERLQVQLGLTLGSPRAYDSEDAEPKLALPEGTGTPAVSKERADVKALERRIEAAVTSQKWNWAEYAPLLLAVVQPTYQTPPTFEPRPLYLQAQLVLSIPLYEGGLRYGQHHERATLEKQARVQFDALNLQTQADLNAALSSVAGADETLKFTVASAEQATEALKLSESIFASGGSTNLEVIDAQRRARDAAIAVALAENACRQARLEILVATGNFANTAP